MGLAEHLKAEVGKLVRVSWIRRPEILLCGNIPKPLHGVAPRVVLGDAWWNAERKAAYKSTDYHCLACGVHKVAAQYHQWLEAHEEYEIDYIKGLMRYLGARPLCHFCHSFIHSGRLQSLLDKGQIHHAKYAAIIQHGDRVLGEAGLARLPPYEGPLAEWGKWRLAIGRKRYKPKFKTYEAWVEHFNKGIPNE